MLYAISYSSKLVYICQVFCYKIDFPTVFFFQKINNEEIKGQFFQRALIEKSK